MIRALVALLAICAGTVRADDDAARWLARMAEALASREYEGTFVYVHEGGIETLRVSRTLGPAGPRDEIVALTGAPRELVREHGELRTTGNGVTTAIATGPAVVYGVTPAALLAASSHYRTRVAGEDRVAGHDTVVVEALPADRDRYAWRFWIERDSGLLLRWLLAGADGKAIEQTLFTEVALRPVDPAAARSASPAAALPQGPAFRTPLPAGFRLVATPPSQGPRRQYVYSDGLANVSLYVEPRAGGLAPIEGGFRRGAINLYGRVDGETQVVVVGDVPGATTQRIALSFDPAGAR